MKKLLSIVSLSILCCSQLTYAQSDDDFNNFLQSLFNDGSSDSFSEGYSDTSSDTRYIDESISEGSELDRAVAWMYQNGLTMFNTVKGFEPNTVLSREAAAKFFGVYADQFLNKQESDSFTCNFSDKSEANQGLLSNIMQACRLWLFKWADGKYLPKSKLTNAQALTVLIKALDGEQASLWRWHRALPFYYKAREIGILENLTLKNSDNLDKQATRWEIAVMMYRTRDMR